MGKVPHHCSPEGETRNDHYGNTNLHYSRLCVGCCVIVTEYFWVLLFYFTDERWRLIEVRYLPTVT